MLRSTNYFDNFIFACRQALPQLQQANRKTTPSASKEQISCGVAFSVFRKIVALFHTSSMSTVLCNYAGYILNLKDRKSIDPIPLVSNRYQYQRWYQYYRYLDQFSTANTWIFYRYWIFSDKSHHNKQYCWHSKRIRGHSQLQGEHEALEEVFRQLWDLFWKDLTDEGDEFVVLVTQRGELENNENRISVSSHMSQAWYYISI